jgi:aminoglycoside phosphotransferase (APT) family kinase protein
MRRVEASAPVIQYVQAGAFVDATSAHRETMIRALMANLVRIHALPLSELRLDLLGDRSGGEPGFLANQIDWALRELHARFPENEEGERAEFHAHIRQTMTDTAQRLKRLAPAGVKPVLAHGDPTIANTMFNDDGSVAAMLDWELAHAGLAAEDVCYFVYAAQSIACLGNVAVELPRIDDVARYYIEAGGQLPHMEFGSAVAAFVITCWGSIGLRRMPKELWEAQRLTWATQSGYLAEAMARLPG